MKSIKVRRAQIEELDILLAFEQGIVEAERPYDPTIKDGLVNYYDISEMIQEDCTEVLVAVDGERLVASGYIKIKDGKPYHRHDQYGYVGYMYVDPEYRGMGISKLILSELTQWAIARGITEIRLDVYSENVSALRAYEKFGFKKHMTEMRIDLS